MLSTGLFGPHVMFEFKWFKRGSWLCHVMFKFISFVFQLRCPDLLSAIFLIPTSDT